MRKFKDFYEGTYAKYILPGVLLQSVLIGGGYATGREIYSYGAKFGAMGWISGLAIGIGFALFAFLTFEICRIYKVYDYKNYIQKVIGPLWPVMDILTVLIAILLIAVMAAASTSPSPGLSAAMRFMSLLNAACALSRFSQVKTRLLR